MRHRTLCASTLLAASAACSSVPVRFVPPAEARVSGDTVRYTGTIDARFVLEAIRLVRGSATPITSLEINSPGGDIDAGMELGLWVRQTGLAVAVDELCFSACANYVLTAARSVRVRPGALVGWHGGAYQKTWRAPRWYDPFIRDRIERDGAYLEYLRSKETAFFQAIGVDQRITTYGQDEATGCQAKSGAEGWFYHLSDLHHMGVKQISLEGGAFSTSNRRGTLRACQLPELFGHGQEPSGASPRLQGPGPTAG